MATWHCKGQNKIIKSWPIWIENIQWSEEDLAYSYINGARKAHKAYPSKCDIRRVYPPDSEAHRIWYYISMF